jgi:hypothetical protein
MSNPCVRQVGRFEDIHGTTVTAGSDYDAVTVSIGLTQAVLTRSQAGELAQLIVAAAFEAGDHAGRIAATL